MRLKIKRLDHHGIVAGVIDDLNIVPLLDKHLPQGDKQEITPGEAIKGMIMMAWDFPIGLCPSARSFFQSADGHLFRKALGPHFNRHKLGRRLTNVLTLAARICFSGVASGL
ncbi:MAG: DUF4277 domain-containing protein [Rheinheimera sp.]|nr:DUF4277 domain-containing protein [Rheinheimera sp.]